MKTTEKKDLQTKTVAELKKLLIDAKNALIAFKLDLQQNELKDTRSIFHTRKRIAILQTMMHLKTEVKEEKQEKGGKE